MFRSRLPTFLYIVTIASISGMSLSAYVRFTTTVVPDLNSTAAVPIESLYENISGYCRNFLNLTHNPNFPIYYPNLTLNLNLNLN